MSGAGHVKKTMGDDRQDRFDVKARRQWWSWWATILATMIEHMVWVDETATYTRMTRTHGRAPRGKRAYVKARKKGRRYTLITAMNMQGLVAKRMIDGGMKLKDWLAFLEHDLLPALQDSTHVIQMDNLDLHKDEDGLEMILRARQLYCFQPAYSPAANPIEEGFSLFKAHLRGVGAKTVGALREAIDSGLQLWTPERVQAWVSHSLRESANWSS